LKVSREGYWLWRQALFCYFMHASAFARREQKDHCRRGGKPDAKSDPVKPCTQVVHGNLALVKRIIVALSFVIATDRSEKKSDYVALRNDAAEVSADKACICNKFIICSVY
jgi:hypothetical protein